MTKHRLLQPSFQKSPGRKKLHRRRRLSGPTDTRSQTSREELKSRIVSIVPEIHGNAIVKIQETRKTGESPCCGEK